MANTSTYFGKLAKKPRGGSKRVIDTSKLKSHLDSLGLPVNASVHINGPSFNTALFSVDFGSPVSPIRLNEAQEDGLKDHMREVAFDMTSGRNVDIRINHDGPNGMYWASVA